MAQTNVESSTAGSGTPFVIIVGASATARQVAARLGRNWRVCVLDVSTSGDTDQVDPTVDIVVDVAEPGVPRHPVEVIHGDGTSRLVLERAGVTDAAALVAATSDDQVNLEAARLARDVFGVRRVFAVCRDPSVAASLLTLGAEPIDVTSAVAGLILGQLDPTIRPAVGVGLGQGEIVEVTILGSSPAIGHPLRLLGARDWLVAAVYRKDELLVPHGDTMLESGDRVVLVGAPGVLPAIAEYFRAGTSAFPLPYGRRLGVAVAHDNVPESFWQEVEYLRESTRAAGVDVFAPEQPSEAGGYYWHVTPIEDVVNRAVSQPGVGCVILPPDDVGAHSWLPFVSSPIQAALARACQPVLVARGSFPYKRVLLAALDRAMTKTASDVAVGLAGLLGATLVGITATPPAFVAGLQAVADQMDALEDAAVLAQVHRVPLVEHHLSGNPIRRVVQFAVDDSDFLVVGHEPGSQRAFWKVDVTGEIVLHAQCSVLAVPPAHYSH